jgi:hypothetical protein
MVAVKPTTISLFKSATLTVGRSGEARVERTVDPKKPELNISDADQFLSVDAYPLRSGSSDVVVKEQSTKSAQSGMAAKLAHYAKHGGSVEIEGKSAKVTGYENGVLTVSSGGAERMINLYQTEKAIKFGSVKPAFVERASPTVSFQLGNVDGKDALHLVGRVSASADVSYRVTIADASDQNAIKAELQPRVALNNSTSVDFEGMSVALKLNEPEQSPFFAKRSRGPALEYAPSADVASLSEGGVSGVITMPIRSKSLNLSAGETKLINFAGAVNGTPNADMDFVAVTLKQKLSAYLDASPDKVGKTQKAKTSPESSFSMSGTKGPQPAGSYELYEGKDRAGEMSTGSYTEKNKNKELTIPGVTMKSIEIDSKVTTLSAEHSEWEAAPSDGPMLPRVRQPAGESQRTTTEQMKQELSLCSKSKYARTVDMTIGVGAFDQGVTNLSVKVGGQSVEAKYDADQGTISFAAPVKANGDVKAEITFTGKRTETRYE